MDTTQTPVSKSSDPKTSREIASAGGNFAEMLTLDTLGCRVSALVLAVSPIEHRKGTSKVGKPFDFFSRETTLFAGPSMAHCVIKERSDSPSSFAEPHKVGSQISLVVKSADIYNGTQSFEIG